MMKTDIITAVFPLCPMIRGIRELPRKPDTRVNPDHKTRKHHRAEQGG